MKKIYVLYWGGIHTGVLDRDGNFYSVYLGKTPSIESVKGIILYERELNDIDAFYSRQNDLAVLNRTNNVLWNCEDYVDFLLNEKTFHWIKYTFFIILLFVGFRIFKKWAKKK